MIRARILLGLCAVLAAVVVAPSAASADPFEGPPICSSAGTALSGSYGNLTVTGNAYVAKGTTLNVWGNLTLAKGSMPRRVHARDGEGRRKRAGRRGRNPGTRMQPRRDRAQATVRHEQDE